MPLAASESIQMPILWSFRRCPYAMRVRLAIRSANLAVELREVLLRDKPAEFVAASAKATVPVLQDGDTVIAESRDVMLWALAQNDPEGLLDMPPEGDALMDQCDGPFKTALDHTKYAVRYPALDSEAERQKAADFLCVLDARLAESEFLTGPWKRLADIAIFPFVRQFANTDRAWFDVQEWPHLAHWLDAFLASDEFAAIMAKNPVWQPGQQTLMFPQ